jgi:hypothetical protein
MGLLNNLMSKILGHAAPAAAKGQQTAAAAPTAGGIQAAGATAQQTATSVLSVGAGAPAAREKSRHRLDRHVSFRGLRRRNPCCISSGTSSLVLSLV